MDYRLEYISKLFEKTSKKRIETYVISRLWHLLSDLDVRFVPQQYVKRNKEKYALTDLYLPQIGMHIEINEPAHYDSEEHIEIDNKRKEEIENKTNHSVRVIDCRDSIENIHLQIDTIVYEIREKINLHKINGVFVPWENGSEFSPDYHKNKGYLKAHEQPSLRTIDDICALFNVKVPMRGYLRQGATMHPTEKDLVIWWPNERNRIWENEISEDGTIIFERHHDIEKRKKHVERVVNQNHRRAVFFCNTDILGFTFYRFKGIYVMEKEQTNPETGIVWKLIENEMKL